MKTKINFFTKIKNSNSKNWWIYAFILGAVLFYLFMSISGVAYGIYTFVDGDSFSGYLPVQSEVARNIYNGDNIFYSWTVNMGMNNIGNVTCYGQLFGISNLMSLIFHFTDASIPAFIALLVKAGLAAMCFQIYSVRYLNSNKLLSLVMSLCYAMCSYQMYMNVVNYFFMDALWILPLLIYFINRYFEDNNWIPLTLCYAYIFINSVYMGYMIGIFTGIYFVCYLFIKKAGGKDRLKCFLGFAYSVLLAVGIFAFLLIPTAYYIVSHPVPDTNPTPPIIINILDVYNQLFIGANNTGLAFFPYIYAGIIVSLICPLYFVNKKIDKKSKIVNILMFAFLIISCFVLKLYLFWHAFNDPDGWGYRFSFLLSFMLCSFVSEELNYIKEIKIRYLLTMVVINSVVYIAEMFLQRKYQEKYQSNDWLYLVINILFMLITILLIYSYNTIYKKIKYHQLVSFLIILVVSFELILNGYASYFHQDNMAPKLKLDQYNQWLNCSKDVYDEIDKKETGNDFYRITTVGELNENSDTFWGYSGTTDFASIENYNLRRTLMKLGIYTSFKLLYPYGYTDFTDMLLGIKYNMNHFQYNEFSPYMNPVNTLEEKKYYIGLGFLVDDKIKEYKATTDSPYENINNLSKLMTGLDVDLFEALDSDKIKLESNGLEIVNENGGQKLNKTSKIGEVGTLTVLAPKDERDAFITFSYGNDYSAYVVESPFLNGGIENISGIKGRLTSVYIKPMYDATDYYGTDICTYDIADDITFFMPQIYVAYYNSENINNIYDSLKDNKLEILDYHNGYVHGKINSTEDRKLLFTSIPYEEGWKVYVNGTERNITTLIEGTFIGVELDEGENDIVFEFTVPYLNIGTYITLASLLLFAISVAVFVVNRKKKNVIKED